MTHGDYMQLLGRYESEARSVETDRLGRERFVEVTASREIAPGTSTIAAHLDKIAATPATAFASAPAVGGRHPVVIFTEYRAPATNSILAEHLASHGFVVVAVPMIGTHELDWDTGVTGIETHVADIRFAVDQVARKPYADATRLAQIGVGIAANVAVAYATRNPELDALVSLDGGVMSPFEVSLMRRTPFFEVAAIRAPMLIVEAPFEGMDRALLSNYRYADKSVVRFPTMREYHFLNYGALEAIAPKLLGDPPARVNEGFAAAMDHVRAFLERQLGKRDANVAPSADGLFTTSFEKGLPHVPTQRELKQIIQQRGVSAVKTLYEEVKKSDPQPFSTEALINTANWFGWQKDNDWKIRRTLFEIYTDSYPRSARGHFALANSCRAQQDKECAKKHYEEALRLLPNDADPSMDAGMRQRIETLAKERLGSG
jgi:hypothetical protein